MNLNVYLNLFGHVYKMLRLLKIITVTGAN